MRKKIERCFRYVGTFAAFFLMFNADLCDAKKRTSTGKKQTIIIKKENNEKEDTPKQLIVMDFDTGEILISKNEDEKCVPSSMTKIMTLYLIFEALESGKLHLDDVAPVSEFAKSMEGSRSFFEAGSLVKIEDLIRSIAVHSGNDGCVAAAEKLAGAEAAFAEMMNEKAAAFGLHGTHFLNSTGLPHEDHYSTLHDLAVIACRVIKDFPQYYHYFSEKTFTANGITQQNRNTLLGNSLHVDGLKTGKTNAGGCGIVASAENNGKRLIVVVNGCRSVKVRAVEANKLLALGFNEYVPVKISDKDTPVGSALVSFGKREKIDLYCKEDIVISIPKKYRKSLLVELRVDEPIEAPILANDKLGTLTYKYGNYTSGKYDLYAHDSVEKVSFLKRIMLNIISFFANSFSKSDKNKISAPMGIKAT